MRREEMGGRPLRAEGTGGEMPVGFGIVDGHEYVVEVAAEHAEARRQHLNRWEHSVSACTVGRRYTHVNACPWKMLLRLNPPGNLHRELIIRGGKGGELDRDGEGEGSIFPDAIFHEDVEKIKDWQRVGPATAVSGFRVQAGAVSGCRGWDQILMVSLCSLSVDRRHSLFVSFMRYPPSTNLLNASCDGTSSIPCSEKLHSPACS